MNGINLFSLLSTILLLASLCATRASSRSFWRDSICSSTEGNLVFSKKMGIATRDSPKISSKGVHCLSECHQLLCVNSIVLNDWCHVSGFEEQKVEMYASISWLNHSVVPSLCGWYVVVNFDLTPRSLSSSCNDFAVNRGSLSEIRLSRSPNHL